MSQTSLAGSRYLQTDSLRSTPWADGRMPIALNRWVQGSSSGWYSIQASPTASVFKQIVVNDINVNHPLAVSTVELGPTVHYNHHPAGQTIGHWIPAYGYSNGGATTVFADPAHSQHVGWDPEPKEYFSFDSTTFNNAYVRSHGLVW